MILHFKKPAIIFTFQFGKFVYQPVVAVKFCVKMSTLILGGANTRNTPPLKYGLDRDLDAHKVAESIVCNEYIVI